jgi:CelD/BcsL family acetyltransferase involved in cellulose biosynthesis
MELRCTVVSEVEELEEARADWEDLLARSDNDEPTLTPLWILSWWRVFGPLGRRALRVGMLREGARLVALLPLVARRVWDHAVPFRRLDALPSGEDEEDEIYSEYIGMIAERGAEDLAAQGFARALVRGEFGAWDEIVLPLMDGSRRAPFAFAEALEKSGALVTVNERAKSPYVPLPSSFDAYLGALSPSRRYLVNRSIRDFERFAGGDLSLRVARTPAELASARATLARLHEARWKTEGSSGVFASERFSAFHDAVMPELFRRGALELAELCARGEPVAALYNVVWKDKVYFYQSGRRADLPGKLRPGIVAHALAIRASIEAGRREYDFLAGAARYKMDLALATRPLVEVRVAQKSLREAMREGAKRAAKRLEELRAGRGAERAEATRESGDV